MTNCKRQVNFVLITFLMFFLCLSKSVQGEVLAKPADATVYMDEKKVDFQAYLIQGNHYFKLRDLAEAVRDSVNHFNVVWNSQENCIELESKKAYEVVEETKKNTVTNIEQNAKPTDSKILVDGRKVDFEGYQIDGSNYFKLRDILEEFQMTVDWNAKENAVYINTSPVVPEEKEKASQIENTEVPKQDVLTAQDIYDMCSEAVFYIETYDMHGDIIGTGSGFFIDKNGTAVTNCHVLEDAFSAKATLIDTRELNIKGALAYDKGMDLAIISVEGSNFHSLDLGSSADIKGGEKIYTLGSPLGLSNTISEGIVSTPNRLVEGKEYIQISAPISVGSSGGALINAKGQAIGVTTAGFFNGQNLNFAVGTDWVKTVIAKNSGQLRSLKRMTEEIAISDYMELPGAFEVVLQEKEPNNTPKEAQYILNGDSVFGIIDDDQPDWYYSACNLPGTAVIYCFSESSDLGNVSVQLLTDEVEGVEAELYDLEDGTYALYAELEVKKPGYINAIFQSMINMSGRGNAPIDYIFYYEFIPKEAEES